MPILTTIPSDDGTPMLPAGKYVVEMVVPPGYELVKEEDKNILIGDNYIAPVTQQFAGLGNIFILPDQAAGRRRLQRQQRAEPDRRPRRTSAAPRGRHRQRRDLLALRRCAAHRARLHQPVPAVAAKSRRSPGARVTCATARK